MASYVTNIQIFIKRENDSVLTNILFRNLQVVIFTLLQYTYVGPTSAFLECITVLESIKSEFPAQFAEAFNMIAESSKFPNLDQKRVVQYAHGIITTKGDIDEVSRLYENFSAECRGLDYAD